MPTTEVHSRPTRLATPTATVSRNSSTPGGSRFSFLRWAPGFVSELQVARERQRYGSSPTGRSRATSTTAVERAGSYVGRGDRHTIDPAISRTVSFDNMTWRGFVGYNFTAGLPERRSSDLTGSAFSRSSSAQRFFVMARSVRPARQCTQRRHSPPTFALYPLIYSGGPNKCTGIVDRSGYADSLRDRRRQSVSL